MSRTYWLCEEDGHEFKSSVCIHCKAILPKQPKATIKPGEIYHGFEDDEGHND